MVINSLTSTKPLQKFIFNRDTSTARTAFITTLFIVYSRRIANLQKTALIHDCWVGTYTKSTRQWSKCSWINDKSILSQMHPKWTPVETIIMLVIGLLHHPQRSIDFLHLRSQGHNQVRIEGIPVYLVDQVSAAAVGSLSALVTPCLFLITADYCSIWLNSPLFTLNRSIRRRGIHKSVMVKLNSTICSKSPKEKQNVLLFSFFNIWHPNFTMT